MTEETVSATITISASAEPCSQCLPTHRGMPLLTAPAGFATPSMASG